MKNKNYFIETRCDTGLKKSPIRWDVFIKPNGTLAFSRNEARRIVRSLNLGRGYARLVKKGESK